jgi:hypothetical protein
VTISRQELGPNERDLQIAVCLAFGMTQDEAAARVVTPEHPTGVTGRTVRNRLDTNGNWINSVIRYISQIRRERDVETVVSTKAQLRELMEKELGSAWAAIITAIRDGDTDNAWRLVEHQLGRPSQVHKVEGETTVKHIIWQPQPVRALLQQERDIADSDLLLKALPEPLEAELVNE